MTRPLLRLAASTCALLCLAAPLHAAPALRLSDDTRARLEAVLSAPSAEPARLGLAVQVLGRAATPATFPCEPLADGPQILFERDGAKRFLPASNIKSFTVASALKYLGADFRVRTRLLGVGKRSGATWNGDLFLVGAGDATLSTPDLESLARAVSKLGIRRVSGRIVGDGSALRGENAGGRYPDSWTIDDALWYYGPPVSALCVDRNQIDISLAPAAPGQLAKLSTSAPVDFPILNRVISAKKGARAGVSIDRADATSPLSNTLTLSGALAVGESFTQGVAVPDPARRAAWILKSALAKSGVQVLGAAHSGQLKPGATTELASHQSPPLSEVAARCLKPSDNLFAEVLLRLTALHAGAGTRAATANRGHSLLRGWLRTVSPRVDAARFADGSGLGRTNQISPLLSLDLLRACESLGPREGLAFWNALPIAGVDGTLRRRMKGTLAEKNLRAKTGSLSLASSLSGYVTTRDGWRLAASFLSSFGTTSEMRALQDQAFVALASADLEGDA